MLVLFGRHVLGRVHEQASVHELMRRVRTRLAQVVLVDDVQMV